MRAPRLLLALLALTLISSHARAREIPFDGGWKFYRAVQGAPAAPPANAAWREVRLPHTTRIEPRIVTDQWQGIAFYRKRFIAPAGWRGQVVLLRFEGAMNVADVRLNGRAIGHHLGGYLPFTLDLTPRLRFGRMNDLVVRLDNRDNPITGPKPLKQLDFNMYGGLYRDVRLLVKPPVHLTDAMLAGKVAGGGLFVTYPEATKTSAIVRVAADVRNARSRPAEATVTERLMDRGRVVARSKRTVRLDAGEALPVITDLAVERPKLWSPKSPALYRLVTEIRERGAAADTVETPVGIRRIAIDGDRFVINGESMFLRGVNRHQEYPYVGYALSDAANVRDARLIKEAGFDYVRLSHYPPSPAFMAAADRLGLVLLDAIPGWQFYNPDPRFRAQVLQTCRDMIRRDRNHPSVFAWECSLNETAMPKDLVGEFNRIVHEEYPGDQAWSAGWQNDGYDIYLQARQHRLRHYAPPGRPYIVSEYGDWEYYAGNAGLKQQDWANLKPEERTSRQSLGAGEARLLQQATNIEEAHNDNLHTPAFADGYWAMFDYNRGYSPDLETSGVMSLERLPKFAYWFFRSQRDADEASPRFSSGPMVRIASYWTAQSSPKIRVFSNAGEVELLLNGRSLGRKRPQRDRMSDRLAHPPFVFDAGKFAPGTLEARAYIGGRLVATDRVETPGPPTRTRVWIDDAGVPAKADDLLFARVEVLDAKGRPVPTFNGVARFAATGDYAIVGDANVPVEGGIGSALLRVARAHPRGKITAQVPGTSGVLVSPAGFEPATY